MFKRYKPKIRLTGPYDFDDVKYLYKCSGLGWNGYGETVDDSYNSWKSIVSLCDSPARIFIWINEFIYKVKKCYEHKQ